MAHKPTFLFQLFGRFCDFNFFLLILIVFLQASVGFKTTFAACPSANFIIGRGFPSGSNNSGSTVGDFNNDGKVDVAVINSLGFNSVVTVTLGNGDGTFQAPMTTPMEPNGVRLATGDFNQDNKLDLAVALSSAGAVGIMLGNGNGTFGLTNIYTAQPGTNRVVVADFNGDNKLDVAASNTSSTHTFSIFLGVGNGTLGVATNYTASTDNRSGGLAVADFDQDGDVDLIVGSVTTVRYFSNGGTGNFSFVSSVDAESYRPDVAVGDINRDTIPDILAGGGFASGAPDVLSHLKAFKTSFSGGQVQFSPAGIRRWGLEFHNTRVTDMAVADVNGDGQGDIVGLNSYNGNLSVIVTGTNGVFTPSINYYAGNSPLNLYLRDLNNDSKPDIIVTNGNGNSYQVLLNLGNGKFNSSYSISLTEAIYPHMPDHGIEGGLITGNINNDSYLDLLGMGGNLFGVFYGAALGNIQGNFNGQVIRDSTAQSGQNYAGVLGDFDSDGKSDYLHGYFDGITGIHYLQFMVGRGDGSFFSPPRFFQLPGRSKWVVAGDFNNDTRLDGVAAIGGTNQIAFLRGNGQGSFNTAVMTSVGSQPVFVAASDFNSDGNLDLATANFSSNNVSILLGNGSGTFAAAANFSVGTNPTHITVKDVNADGISDIITANSGTTTVSVLTGNGNGGFGAASNINVGSSPFTTSVADFNNDGIIDIATVNRGSSSNSVSINLGTGGGAFGTATHLTYGMHEPIWAIAQDVNFDSRPDLIIAHRGSNQLNVLINSCEAFNLLRPTPFDYDGDGKTDISIFRPAQGEWWYQKSSNGGNFAAQFGSQTDKIVPADYTGDDKTDFAFFRPSNGQWFVLRSEDFSFYAFPFGVGTDTPVPADYDGDGKADPAVFRPSTNTWFINKSTGGTDIIGFGTAGDKPVPADYDGDGKVDIAIFRPNGAEWWIRRSSNASVFAVQFGTSTDKAVQGDFTGDGKSDIAFWRPSNGTWFVLRSEDFSFFAFPFGASTDVPVAGDYDGDGRFDAGVFRPSGNTWFVQRSTAGTLIQTFGIAGDLPTPNAFVP